jgi:hypothetical protein
VNGFVSICNQTYLPILNVLMDGLDAFSKYPLEVFWVSDEPMPEPTDRTTFRKLPSQTAWQKIMFSKIDAVVQTSFEHGVFLDADIVPNRNIDQLIEMAAAEPCPYPLCSAHPHGPVDIPEIMEMLGVKKRTMHYCYGNYLFSPMGRG